MTLDEMTSETMKQIGDTDPNSESTKTAVVVFAAVQEGASVDKVVAFTGYERDFVQRIGERLTAAGIWSAGNTRADWMESGDGISLHLDLNVAMGRMNRTVDQNLEPRYSLTEEGKRYVEEKLLPKR